MKKAARIDWRDPRQIAIFQKTSSEEAVREITEMTINIEEMFEEEKILKEEGGNFVKGKTEDETIRELMEFTWS